MEFHTTSCNIRGHDVNLELDLELDLELGMHKKRPDLCQFYANFMHTEFQVDFLGSQNLRKSR